MYVGDWTVSAPDCYSTVFLYTIDDGFCQIQFTITSIIEFPNDFKLLWIVFIEECNGHPHYTIVIDRNI